jgi:hypothetical protein
MGHETDAEIHEPPTRQRVRISPAAWVLISVALLLAALPLTYYVSGSAERGAKNACQVAVDNELKAPSTARYTDMLASKDGPSWLVNGKVDAQNSFGAQIRSSFKCTVTNGTATVDYVI